MPNEPSDGGAFLDEVAIATYREAMLALAGRDIPFLVGGAYAFSHYTGIQRHTKDFDLFLRRRDVEAAVAILDGSGFRGEVTFPHWLAKAWRGEYFVDLIFSAGNGVAEVDDLWFAHAKAARIFDVDVLLIPAEEMIWSKGFIMERERFDGADVAHLLLARGDELDWRRLLRRFAPHWRVLLAHLVLFGFIFPAARHQVPQEILRLLLRRLDGESNQPPPDDQLCQGTLLSRQQYLSDLERGWRDARLAPGGTMSEEEIAWWTEAIGTID